MTAWITAIDRAVWGPGTLALLLGTGVYLTVRTRFLAWRNLGWALRSALGRGARARRPQGDVSPFASLMTMLAATIGTGNIVGVATALASGGPGALVWMELSALFGLTSQFAECMLAVKYRQKGRRGEMRGGPMYVMARAFPDRRLGTWLGTVFALFTVLASLGMGNMAQANSIAAALRTTFTIPARLTGLAVAALALLVILGGIRRIARAASVLVPLMAAVYMAAGLAVILANWQAVPGAVADMFRLAFSPRAAAGGAAGASVLTAMRWGVSRGVFSNEAGMGSAAITAASAATDSPVRQGYISMTSTFFDTTVICTVTGLAICASGALDAQADGAALTILAFQSALGPAGGVLVSLGVALFAFASILGWEYQGETALSYLTGGRTAGAYRMVFALAAFLGAVADLELVFQLSDIFNALMALPNLVCLLALSGTVSREMRAFQPQIRRKRSKKL